MYASFLYFLGAPLQLLLLLRSSCFIMESSSELLNEPSTRSIDLDYIEDMPSYSWYDPSHIIMFVLTVYKTRLVQRRTSHLTSKYSQFVITPWRSKWPNLWNGVYYPQKIRQKPDKSPALVMSRYIIWSLYLAFLFMILEFILSKFISILYSRFPKSLLLA